MLLRRPETRGVQAEARVALATRLVSAASLRRRLQPALPARRVTRTGPASRLAGVGLTSAGLQVTGGTGVAGRAGPAASATIAQAMDAGRRPMANGPTRRGRLADARRRQAGSWRRSSRSWRCWRQWPRQQGCGARGAAALLPRLRGRARGEDASRQVGGACTKVASSWRRVHEERTWSAPLPFGSANAERAVRA